MFKVLVADDDQGLRLSVKSNLESTKKFQVDDAFDGINALEKFQNSSYDFVILDIDMPRMNGLEALKKIKEINPGVIVVMMTAFASIESAIQSVKDGAFHFLSKPVKSEDLIQTLDKAIEALNLMSNAAASAPVLMQEGRNFVGKNQQMQKVFNVIHRLSKVDTPVLIRGASGTGKELVARAIHFNSNRKDEKFVAINCSAIPENLFESELFGHEKGSFTGADQRKIGKFQFAEGGTLFMDEVGDMPMHMQVKLLRVLQEKSFTPVGANREIPTNVRILAATNRPLEDMIKKGTFREDLFYRLNVIPILLPSLVDRKDDLENLINLFIKKFNISHCRKITGLTPDALVVLKKYEWPGNIRELENVIEHMFIMENGHSLSLASVPESILNLTGTVLPNFSSATDFVQSQLNEGHQRDSSIQSDSYSNSVDLSDEELDLDLNFANSESADSDIEEEAADLSLNNGRGNGTTALDFNAEKESFEKEFIIKALKMFKGRINQTALHANIPKKTLLRKIEKYGINAKEYSS